MADDTMPSKTQRAWIMLAYSIMTLIAAVVVIVLLVADPQFDFYDMLRGLGIIGTPVVAGYFTTLAWSSITMDPITIVAILCLPAGAGLWFYSQQFTANAQMRDTIMSFGSAIVGIFVGWLGSVTQKARSDARA